MEVEREKKNSSNRGRLGKLFEKGDIYQVRSGGVGKRRSGGRSFFGGKKAALERRGSGFESVKSAQRFRGATCISRR